MRSRNGNCNLLLRLLSIVFLSSLSLSASEFLISYQYTVKNAVLYNETLEISRAMKKCSGVSQKELFLQNTTDNNLKKIISQNSEEFIDYIHKLGLHVKHEGTTTNLQNSSITTLTLKTTCFEVDFNDSFVKIAPLKEGVN
ncbi:hypothetical protein [Sulfurimonas sp.]|uniref:hypothetical protein n=1 Tax=Sulfurimonas sp. TaxID=2022749 RepID=UPI0025F31D9F|nr:hypothetical protein [Sulfurimonas sp.]MDD5158188.1 hypothetical protein [Sulfurimonas sp.]